MLRRRCRAMLVVSLGVVPAGAGGTAAAGLAAQALPGTVTRASVANDGSEGDDRSQEVAISADGRYVAFQSYATNLVPGDTNDQADIFVRDLVGGTTERVNVSSAEAEADDYSGGVSISADGRYVAFYSHATNLVSGDTNGERDVFVRDRTSGTTERVSVSSAGEQGNNTSTYCSLSADGRYVAFASDANNLVMIDGNGQRDVFVRDRDTDTTVLASVSTAGVQGLTESTQPKMSGNGLYVVFVSYANNLVADDTNSSPDIFRRVLGSNMTERLSVDSDEVQGNGMSSYPAVSFDGRYTVFNSISNNLVTGDNNGEWDVFLRDAGTGTTERINVNSAEEEAIGIDHAPDTVNLSVSADGRYVTWRSDATNLVTGDTNGQQDIFLRDRTEGITSRVSVSLTGLQGNGSSWDAAIASAGRYVAFQSDADNLVQGDENYQDDIFVKDLVGDPEPVVNIEGTDRFETAIAASERAYPDGLDPSGELAVVIATGRNWPDALGGVALAGVLDAPVLLVDTNSVPDAVMDEVARLGAQQVVILGGESAVGLPVESEFNDWFGEENVDRIAGTNRYETANLIAGRVISEQGPGFDGTAFVATGGNFPDALAAAPLAAANGWPLYLSHPANGLSDATKAAMGDVEEALLLGGEAVVLPAVEDYLEGELGDSAVTRLAGANRYATAVEVATYGVDSAGLGWNRVGITTGEKFPDALAGGVLQGKAGSVMLLTRTASLDPAAAAALTANKADIESVTFFGGLSAVSDAVRTAVGVVLE